MKDFFLKKATSISKSFFFLNEDGMFDKIMKIFYTNNKESIHQLLKDKSFFLKEDGMFDRIIKVMIFLAQIILKNKKY